MSKCDTVNRILSKSLIDGKISDSEFQSILDEKESYRIQKEILRKGTLPKEKNIIVTSIEDIVVIFFIIHRITEKVFDSIFATHIEDIVAIFFIIHRITEKVFDSIFATHIT